jgi:GNAT superfamily N-acetyltransferase
VTEPEDAAVRDEETILVLRGARGGQEAAGAAVRELAAAAGVDPSRLTGVRAIVEELVRESQGRPAASVEALEVTVRAHVHSARLTIEVTDNALPVSPRESRLAPSRRLAAVGFVDQLHMGAHGREGNRARAVVRLDPARLESVALAEPQLAEDAPRASDEEVAALELRPMAPEESRELVRCVYRCYGYSYLDPILYEPRAIAHAIRSEQMYSIVAVEPGGSIIGHIALFTEEAGDPVPEAGRLVVDPRYRGHGIASRLAQRRSEHAREVGLPGFWAECVTNHVASQREVIAGGGAEVGLLIGVDPPTMHMAGLGTEAVGRQALLPCFTAIDAPSATIHAPAAQAELMTEIAARLGVDRELSVGEPPAAGAETSLSSLAVNALGNAHIRVGAVGADIAERIEDAIESYDAFEIGAFHVDLPLTDPGAPAAAERLERLGFSFAAWMPCFDAGADALRLQRIGSHPVDTEHIECARPEGEAVRDYAIAEWHRVRRLGASPAP